MLTISEPMANPLGTVIREARKARKMTQVKLAAAFGISRPAVTQWESGGTGPERERLPALAELLRIDLGALMRGDLILLDDEGSSFPSPAPNARKVEVSVPVDPVVFKGSRNVPVYGTGVGGSDGDFRFNGQRIDHAPRPPGIADRLDVYAIYVVGDSMAPAYEDGTLIYVDPHRRPAPRDYVVVEKYGPSENEPGDAFVKRLIRRSSTKVVVEQYNPEAEIIFNDADVKRVHRVIPWHELIGI